MELSIKNSLEIKKKTEILNSCIPEGFKTNNIYDSITISKGIFKCLIKLNDIEVVFKCKRIDKNVFYPILIKYIDALNSFSSKASYLDIENLYKKYKGNNFYSLEDVNLSFKKGEIIGLLGHNGAGKSTLIKSLVGQEEITKGNVSALGVNNKEHPDIYKSYFSYIPDHYILFDDFSGREYVNYIADLYNVSLENRRKYISYYLRIFKLTNSFDAKISTYSFGMKQKITIISSLICQPKIWLLDEPLTGLDPDSIIQIKNCIKEHAEKGNIVLFSSHLIDVVEELASRIVILKKGKVIYNETKNRAMKDYNDNLDNLYMEKVGMVK